LVIRFEGHIITGQTSGGVDGINIY